MSDQSDPAIEQIEVELRASRFEAWDVETFLADRHQAKILALEASENKWVRRWQVVKEIYWAIMAFIGCITTMTAVGVWLLTGEFLFHRL